MSAPAGSWSPEGQARLASRLEGTWATDVWDLHHLPARPDHLQRHAPGNWRYLRLACRSGGVGTELKYFVWHKLQTVWRVSTLRHAYRSLRILMRWFDAVAPATPSLLARDLGYWELSLRSYLVAQGLVPDVGVTKGLDRAQRPVSYRGEDRRILLLRDLYATLADAYDERDEYDKDVWDLRRLGIPVDQTRSSYHLRFAALHQPWLRMAAKQFSRHGLASGLSPAYVSDVLGLLGRLSAFLRERHPDTGPADLARPVVLDFLSTSLARYSAGTYNKCLSQLNQFLEACGRHGWAGLPARQCLYREDYRPPPVRQPRFIPDDVVAQLNRHVDALPAAFMRMVLIIQACGMRLGELLTLPRGCLFQDGDGDWWLRYAQGKQRKEHTIPLSHAPEIVAIIREQQHAVLEQHGDRCRWLFPSALSSQRPYAQVTFHNALNKLAYHKAIRDATGRLFRFESHQFRHTVGTTMINRGYPLHVVQRYLGHESPRMTQVYARLHDATLKREFAKFAAGQVDVTGGVAQFANLDYDAVDLQWFKHNLHAQALPHGTCWLPATKGRCPHANACFTCAHWRTDRRYLPVLQQQLGETQQILAKARAGGWARQVETNEQVERNLVQVIAALDDLQEGRQP